MIRADVPLAIRVGRALEEVTIGKREADDDFVSVMMANNARKIIATMRVPDMAVTMAFHNAVGRPIGVSAEDVWAAMIDAAIGVPFGSEEQS